MIEKEVIEAYQPAQINLPANTFLFHEGEHANFYYQVISGEVKMININPEGKEFVQGVFSNGQSFGEPPLFHEGVYPASSVTTAPSLLFKLRKDKFFNLLKDHPDEHLKFTKVLTKRLMYKAMIMKEISSHDAQHRILTFIDHLKREYGDSQEPFPVDLTRQQLSNLLGIRVETVIRAIKLLAEAGELTLSDRKILR